MATETFTILGGVNVQIIITEIIDPATGLSSLEFQVDVLDDTGSIGDLNALYFDLANDTITSGLSVTGDDITGSVFKVDGVTKVSNFTNMNGEVINEFGKFDGGVQFGTSGIGADDIRSTTFTLSSSTGSLSLADFSMQDFGVRLTSVGPEDGSRAGSLKLGGTAPEFDTEPEVENAAVADTMTVFETETFNVADSFDFLSNGSQSVLANDTTGAATYTGDVAAVGGDAMAVGQIVPGSNGGALIIYADGSVDFSATGPNGVNTFLDLNYLEQTTTTFDYAIAGGSTASVIVTVLGLDDLPPPPIDVS